MNIKQNKYNDMSDNELMFLIIYHLTQQNYHDDLATVHKQEATYLLSLLNSRDSEE